MPSATWQELPPILGTRPALGWGVGSASTRTPLGSFTPVVRANSDAPPISAKPTLGFNRQPLVVEEKPANRQRNFPFLPTGLATSIQPKTEPATFLDEPQLADAPSPPAIERRPSTENRENTGPQFPDLPLPESAKLRQKPLGLKRQHPEPPPPLGQPLPLPEIPNSDVAQPLPQPSPPALPRSPQSPNPVNLDTTNRAGNSFDESVSPKPATPLQRRPEPTIPQLNLPVAPEPTPTDQPSISPVPETTDRPPPAPVEESQAIQPAQENLVAPPQTEEETRPSISLSPLESPSEEWALQPDEESPRMPTVQADEDVSAFRSPPTESPDSTNQPSSPEAPDVSREVEQSSPSPSPPPLQPTRDETDAPFPPVVEEQSRSDLLQPSEEPSISDLPSSETFLAPPEAGPLQPATPTDQQPQSPTRPPNLINRVPINTETEEVVEPSPLEAMDVAPEESISSPETTPTSPEFPDSAQEIADAPNISPSVLEVEDHDIPEISPTEEIFTPTEDHPKAPVELTDPSTSDTPQPTGLTETPETDAAIQRQIDSPPSIDEDSGIAIPEADLTESATPSAEPQQREPSLRDLLPAKVSPDPQDIQDLISQTPEPQTFSPESQQSAVNLDDDISEDQLTSALFPNAPAIQPQQEVEEQEVEEQEAAIQLDSDIDIQSRNTETSHLPQIRDIAEPPSSPYPPPEITEPPPEDATPSLPLDPVTRLTRPLGHTKPLLQPKLPLMDERPTDAEPQEFQKVASPPTVAPQLPGGEMPRAVTAATAPWQQQFQLEDSPNVAIPTMVDTGLPTPKSATARALVEKASALATGPPVTLPGLKPQSDGTQANAEELELLARVLYGEWLNRQALSRATMRGQWPAHSPWIADYRLNVTAEAPRNNIFDRQQWRSDLVTQAMLEPSINTLFREVHHAIESRLSCRGGSS